MKNNRNWLIIHIDLKLIFAKDKETRPNRIAVTSLGVSGSNEILIHVTVSLNVAVPVKINPKIIIRLKIYTTHLFRWVNNQLNRFSLFVFLWIANKSIIQINVMTSASTTLNHESRFAVCNNGGRAKTWFFKPTLVIIKRIIWKIEIDLELFIVTAPIMILFPLIFCILINFILISHSSYEAYFTRVEIPP